MEISLERVMFDLGYPDPGHYEYVLMGREKRKYKLMQSIFGDKKKSLMYYGEDKPSDETITMDIERYMGL